MATTAGKVQNIAHNGSGFDEIARRLNARTTEIATCAKIPHAMPMTGTSRFDNTSFQIRTNEPINCR